MHSAGQHSWGKGASWDPSKGDCETSQSCKMVQTPSRLALSAGHVPEHSIQGGQE